eukprot:273549-Pyramimonas_sp.AAC.1
MITLIGEVNKENSGNPKDAANSRGDSRVSKRITPSPPHARGQTPPPATAADEVEVQDDVLDTAVLHVHV